MNRYAMKPMLGYATAGSQRIAVAVFVLAVVLGPMGSWSFAQTRRVTRPREASRGRGKVIVSLRQDVGELAERSSTPMLRIYKDGRVRVFFPKYMKRAGHYMLHLSDYELDRLIGSLANKGLMEFNAEEVRAEKKQRDRQRMDEVLAEGLQPTFYYTTDDTKTVIEIDVDDYRPRGSRTTVHVQKQIVWRNLQWDAERYPDVKAIQDLAAATRELKALTEREDLLKLYNN
jgi:hypothetical protein